MYPPFLGQLSSGAMGSGQVIGARQRNSDFCGKVKSASACGFDWAGIVLVTHGTNQWGGPAVQPTNEPAKKDEQLPD